MPPLRLGMLGMWHSHASGVVREAAAHPDDYTIVAAWDPEPAVVADRSAKWKPLIPGLRVLPRPADVLREPIDAVVVEGRVHENLKWATLALEAGFSVLLEKPAGMDLEEHRKLIRLAQAKHLHVQMAYIFRYMSAVVELLARTRKGELGDVYEFRARLPKDLRDYARFEEELALYRGGIFFEMAGHVIDMMVSVLGPPGKVTPFLAHHARRPGKFVDNGIAVFEYDHAFGIIEVPQLEVAQASRRIEVYGTRGAVVIPHLGSGHLANRDIQPIEVWRDGAKEWERLDLQAATLHTADLAELAAIVARKKMPEYSLEHDLAVQEALLRASGMA